MLSPSIQRLHTKFQPNQLKNDKVTQVFHFQAGWLVGWQVGLAGQHAQMHINHIHMLRPSIQRLHTKFQPNRLKNAKVMRSRSRNQFPIAKVDEIDGMQIAGIRIYRTHTVPQIVLGRLQGVTTKGIISIFFRILKTRCCLGFLLYQCVRV